MGLPPDGGRGTLRPGALPKRASSQAGGRRHAHRHRRSGSFDKGVLNAFVARGDTIVSVFAAPEKPGSHPDPLVVAAEEKKFPVYRFPKCSDPEALRR